MQSNGTEDGIIEFSHIKAGSQVITGRWRSDSLQLLNGTALTVAGSTTVTGNIIPSSDSATDIGTSSVRFASIYTDNLDVGGNLFVADSILHTGDTHTKIRFSGGDTIVLQTGGSERLTIDSSGRLLVNGATSNNAFSGGDDLIIGNSSGNTRSGLTLVSNSGQDGGVYFSDGTSVGNAHVAGQIVYDHDGDYMRFFTVASERLRITSAGKVGINESSPLGKLHVKSGDSGVSAVGSSADELVLENDTNAFGMSILSATNGEGGINFGDSDDVNIGKIAYNHNDNAMFVKTNDVERLRITIRR